MCVGGCVWAWVVGTGECMRERLGCCRRSRAEEGRSKKKKKSPKRDTWREWRPSRGGGSYCAPQGRLVAGSARAGPVLRHGAHLARAATTAGSLRLSASPAPGPRACSGFPPPGVDPGKGGRDTGTLARQVARAGRGFHGCWPCRRCPAALLPQPAHPSPHPAQHTTADSPARPAPPSHQAHKRLSPRVAAS